MEDLRVLRLNRARPFSLAVPSIQTVALQSPGERSQGLVKVSPAVGARANGHEAQGWRAAGRERRAL